MTSRGSQRGWRPLMHERAASGSPLRRSACCSGCSSSSRWRRGRDGVVNPEITARSGDGVSPTRAASRSRACSSRSSGRLAVTLEGRDLEGGALRLELDEPDARVVQHELDHLDGVLMLERTDPESRRDALATLRRRL